MGLRQRGQGTILLTAMCWSLAAGGGERLETNFLLVPVLGFADGTHHINQSLSVLLAKMASK